MNATRSLALAATLALSPVATAQVFLSEVFINPPGNFDDTREFVELSGTPNMKLDGYAVAFVFGMQEKFVDSESVPPQPPDEPEIDEFFPLDGLTLGRNGILVLGIGQAANYPLTQDANFQSWSNLWSGPFDVPGKLQNDGSITVLLVRNRPGITQYDPANPAGPLWVKDASVDREIAFGVIDPSDGMPKVQVGNGSIDEAGVNAIAVPMFDFRGKATPAELDDLEIVDEVSYEHDRGWEYDFDDRKVDVGSAVPGLPERKVHQLDDPQGINPDALTRVDHRTKGVGHAPAAGAVGQLPGGNNWQDTATEQWIRGESLPGSSGIGSFPFFFYDVTDNQDPNAIQPYATQVPLWLADGNGPDFDFATQFDYQILAGHRNRFAVPFVPGDTDRDGDCDAEDVARIRARFGDDTWIFSNSHAGAAQGNDGDPASQTRPWDLDVAGESGIDANDLQWALNFQGDITGRIVGVTYDSSGPSVAGVPLGDPQNVAIQFDATASIPCGAAPNALRINDVVEIVVRGTVTGGANFTPGFENGIQQIAHEFQINTLGVLAVVDVEWLGGFEATREGLTEFPFGGQLGARRVFGVATGYTAGLGAAADLYRVTLRAVGPGSATTFITAPSDPKLALNIPFGAKVARTDANGDPATANYPGLFNFTVGTQVGGLIAEYGTGCQGDGGATPTLDGSGCARPGGALTLAIADGKPGAIPNLFIGLSNGAASINPNCQIAILPILPNPLVLPALAGSAPGTGALTIANLPLPPSLPIGVSAYLQVLYADPAGFGGLAATNPLQLTFGL
jgi:hypothetical protein